MSILPKARMELYHIFTVFFERVVSFWSGRFMDLWKADRSLELRSGAKRSLGTSTGCAGDQLRL